MRESIWLLKIKIVAIHLICLAEKMNNYRNELWRKTHETRLDYKDHKLLFFCEFLYYSSLSWQSALKYKEWSYLIKIIYETCC